MPLSTTLMRGADAATRGRLTVALDGSLDTATAPDLEKQLQDAIGNDVRHVVFDLAGLQFISSAGLRVLSWTRKRVKERAGHVSIVHAQPQIKAVFEVIKSLPGLGLFADMAELDAYLAARQKAALEGAE